ncbi:hypothetical protein RYF71_02525 [Wolbachia endosymbiont of Drosophila malagassya]|uniref:hypothetical protein n=1 Tax=unclassified Wolbachia TaxID=2640676 RepID=UPI0023A9830A|nr:MULTISPECIES: hypothetical protein [unclassified Wolbachia]MDU8940914.1 hypothetical protein [Wolbachia endosymbiont of Drosophila malagassya]BEP32232.1 MAG: hypothetical protein WBIAU2_04590 [Wolbachia endosymbiont of Drosophila biauraria]MDE5064849.1 hypothetical protein [Wolbachia endosymbiont of Drosophila tristis]MDE5065723.1 hypothetical protein [Wolbachia endosymbiont of Drosophila seguyi]MDU8920382.1 hypothetical protein [Wolbachia endosymbiont of Drosophila tristis]
MNGGVSGKEKVIRTPFDFKEPYSDWRQIFKRPNQQYNPSNYDSSSEINEHDIETQKIEEGDGHDSGISSDDEDDRTTYTAVQLTNDSLDSAGQIKPVKPKRNFLAECMANFIYNFVEKSFLQL